MAPRTAGAVAIARLRWFLLVLAVLVASLFVTWRLLAAVDFAYPALYDLLDIDQTIAEFAPRNDRKRGFAQTDAEEHARLFGAIVEAVRDGGRGLEEITYRGPDGTAIDRMLTEAEIEHLHDVAGLIGVFERLGWLALALALVLVTAAALRRERPPSPLGLLAGFGAAVAAGVVVVLLLGPVEVFYWLHIRIFPPDHQWFFWYEESLMSTTMQAPNLFGAIAVIWLLPAVLLTAAALLTLIRLLERRAPAASGSAREKTGTTNGHE